MSLPLDPDVSVTPRPYPHPWSLIRANADLLPVIALGGALGSLGRWGLAEALPHDPEDFAWATWLANIAGAFLLGLLMAFVLERWSHHRYTRPFLGVGVLGGFTTFSTWMLDTRAELVSRPLIALSYVVATLLCGLVAVTAGLALGRRLAAPR
ncbi:fluoride efflux transporter FluC [Nocardioides sp. Kera G14]|uniref:fluoride efflux transporter FluC n=1 Tax=Nocardioides sp. Kera G14 TaxID=2884264 RepID=UPI001D12A62A|nr:CrcB family protein [Nocardioides sp. Kera G14]UDY24034.1 CrcB family protein [Nocardioides sp. Kera G14]